MGGARKRQKISATRGKMWSPGETSRSSTPCGVYEPDWDARTSSMARNSKLISLSVSIAGGFWTLIMASPWDALEGAVVTAHGKIGRRRCFRGPA